MLILIILFFLTRCISQLINQYNNKNLECVNINFQNYVYTHYIHTYIHYSHDIQICIHMKYIISSLRKHTLNIVCCKMKHKLSDFKSFRPCSSIVPSKFYSFHKSFLLCLIAQKNIHYSVFHT